MWTRLPSLIVFLLRSALLGFALGVALACVLVLTNAGGLHDLLINAQQGVVALLAFMFLFGLTVGSAVVGTAIMWISRDGGGE